MPGTRITKITLVASVGGQIVANARNIALPPGSFIITQYVWYTMSNGQARVATNSQRVTINRYDPPPPPPPPVTYEFYGIWAGYGILWSTIRRQGSTMRATFYGGE